MPPPADISSMSLWGRNLLLKTSSVDLNKLLSCAESWPSSAESTHLKWREGFQLSLMRIYMTCAFGSIGRSCGTKASQSDVEFETGIKGHFRKRARQVKP